jgi:hypothetical protein
MCFSQPSMPAPPPLPPMPPPAPTPVDAAVVSGVNEQRKRSASSAGYGGTIATGGLGVATPAFTTANMGKTMLGS